MEESIIKPKFKKTSFDRIDFLKIAESTIHASAPYKTYAHFRIDHTHRVYFLACLLSKHYPMGTFDLKKISVMCAIHDMFKYATDGEHGNKAADFLLTMFIDEYFPPNDPDRDGWLQVVEAIRLHSYKDCDVRKMLEFGTNHYLEILMDADILDKIHHAHLCSLQRVFMKNLTLNQIKGIVKQNIEEYNGLSKGYEIVKRTMLEELDKKIK